MRLLWAVGLVLVVLSATPLPFGYYALAGIVSLVWLILAKRTRSGNGRTVWFVRGLNVLFAGLWIGGILWEAPFHRRPRLTPVPVARLTVIGDSVSAGLGQRGDNAWPERLRQKHAVEVVDLSAAGATAGSAVRMVRDVRILPGIVLVQIGGNDLLGHTSVGQFEKDLEELLALLQGDDRQLVMFELPLPPLANRFGQAQRNLARTYRVRLIPKRVFLDVLLSSETTLDTIHLNQAGHEKMAKVVWEMMAPAVVNGDRGSSGDEGLCSEVTD